MAEEAWHDIRTDPPADGQYVRVKSIVHRDAWYLPSNKFSTWIGRAKQDDEQAEPMKWKPIEGAQTYYEEFH